MRLRIELFFYLLIYFGIGFNMFYRKMNDNLHVNEIPMIFHSQGTGDRSFGNHHFLFGPELSNAGIVFQKRFIALVPVISEAFEAGTTGALTGFIVPDSPRNIPLRIPVFTGQNLFQVFQKMKHSIPVAPANRNILVCNQQ